MEISEIKNFWNERPCNIKHSQSEFGTFKYFEEVDQRRYLVEPHILEFADFEKWKNKKVLEIGCGIGTDSVRFAKAGAKITCVELSEKSLEICKSRFKEYGLSGNFYSGNAEELSKFLPIEDYDLIYSFGVIHHTINPLNVFEEIKKYMNKDTECRVMLYVKHSWKSWEFYFKYGWKFNFNLKKTIQYFAEAQLNCPVANVYTKKELESLLSDFKIISIKKDHIFPYIIKDYIEYKYNKRFIFKILPNSWFKKLKSLLGWHYLIQLKYAH